MKNTLALLGGALLFGCGGSVDAVDHENPDGYLGGGVYDENFLAVDGATVCVDDEPDISCTTTGADGRFELRLFAGEDVVLSVTKPDRHTRLVQRHVEEATFEYVALPSDAWYDDIFAAAGTTSAPETGLVVVQVFGEPAGARVAIDPMRAADPVYVDERQQPDTSLHLTSSFGTGVFVNVPAGVYAATAVHERGNLTCTPAAFGRDGYAELGARAGTVTYVALRCTAEPDTD
jgi:hypothetical protein